DDLVAELCDGPVIMGENFLNKVVEELVDNACLYSPPRTPIRLTTTQTEDQFILKVQDAGRGMTAQQIAEIGAFRQFDRQKYEQQGMGLGLFIARRLTELYGGVCRIESEHDKGTTVELRLPARPKV
ncbi:MAG: ATP-binding protein, partial [Desulfobacterales bacterium]|nr:ATP-binding protein [Desulfobacterales bacterium]